MRTTVLSVRAPTRFPAYRSSELTRGRFSAAGLDFPTVASAILITSYFYCLPLGRYSVGGFGTDFRAYDIVNLLFLLCIGPQFLRRVQLLWRDSARFFYWGVVLSALAWVSLAFTFSTSGAGGLPAVIRAIRFSVYLIVPAFLMVIASTPRRLHLLLGVFYINTVIQAVLAFGQGLHLIPNLWPDYWLRSYAAGEQVLPIGTLSPHHKQIGVVMVLGVGLSLFFARASSKVVYRILALSVVPIMVAVPIFGGSRTAWLGFIALGVGFLLVYRTRAGWVALLAVLTAGAGFLLMPDVAVEKMKNAVEHRLIDVLENRGVEGLGNGRLDIYLEQIPSALARQPWILLTGTGFANGTSIMGMNAHNNYAQALVELGIAGLVIFLIMLHRVWRTLHAAAVLGRCKFDSLLAKDLMAVFFSVLTTMLVGETLWSSYSMFTLTGQVMGLMALGSASLNWAATGSPLSKFPRSLRRPGYNSGRGAKRFVAAV